MKNFVIVFNFIIILFASCSSKSKESIATNTELLTGGIWTETHDYEKINGNYVEFGASCNKDDTWEFSANGEVVSTEGLVRCDPDEPAQPPITVGWNFEINDTRLVFVYPLDEVRFDIVSITANELILDELDPGTNTPTIHRVILRR